ncbi:serine hydrolase [Solimonas sp. SE-A11]|uniref:serine hydrolase domain-containing protein n=1 Tax=Solimonas sp. SE-A11 TaxID=3054954 RepID=UPI00259C6BEA|nr:serine hydrolase domain-containing protein [Solimonas sp. SE-A11]MDM4772546.1 serine hydrolase domain-containing protein [Solimonas sp. SE-A11]
MDLPADHPQKLDALLKPWNNSDAPGFIVGVAHRGRTVYRRGFGLASIQQGQANTPQTRMRIGSTTKHFTCLAALLLAQEGRLDIDAPLRQYLPELDSISGEPSLRECMLHTSGLRDPNDLLLPFLNKTWNHYPAPGHLLQLANRVASLNFPRGERMIYCNQGYHLLSRVIERISGQALGDFLRERILAPAGMHDTELLTSDHRLLPRLADLHLKDGDGWRRGLFPSEELLGEGGMVSTVDDMLNWLARLRNPATAIGGSTVWDQMLRKPRYSSGAEGDYCLGLIREQWRGIEIVHHAGGVIGGNSQMLAVPAHELDVIVLCNRNDASAPALANQIVEALLGAAMEPFATPAPRPGLLGRWYAPGSHRLIGLLETALPGNPDKVLAMSIQSQNMGALLERDGQWILNCSPHGRVTVTLPSEERPQFLQGHDNGHAETWQRLPDNGPAAEVLAAELLGRYRDAELCLEAEVVLIDGGLHIDLLPATGHSRLHLTPYSLDVCGFVHESNAFANYPVVGSLALERENGRVTGLWLSTARTRNLHLLRSA